jgi:hypothetical protein
MERKLAVLFALANVAGTVLAIVGIGFLRAGPSIPFYEPDGLYTIGLYFPMPPDWLVLTWAHAAVPILLAGIAMPFWAMALVDRGRLLQGWIILAFSAVAVFGTGVWVGFHGAFNASLLTDL